LRGTASFGWTVKDVFLPERRTMPQVGIPLENQWSRWPGAMYALPVQCWVGPHHSAVITGIARAGLDALPPWWYTRSCAADSAREAMAFKRDSRLAECWRDLRTVGQTVTLASEWYPIGGRV
jgi:hypothetical protein